MNTQIYKILAFFVIFPLSIHLNKHYFCEG